MGISCFVTKAGLRRQGIATALLPGAVDWARQNGARVLDACPVDAGADRPPISLYHLYIETPASITLRTGRLGGYEAARDVGLSPAAQRTQEEFARAAEAREHAAEQAQAEFQRIWSRRACRCARQTLPIPYHQPPGAKPKARTRAR